METVTEKFNPMTPNNLLYCETCRSYTRHTFVVNTGVCNVCIKENKPNEEWGLVVAFKKIGSLFS